MKYSKQAKLASERIFRCIDSAADLELSAILDTTNSRTAARYKYQAQIEAYMLGADGSIDENSIPGLIKSRPELAIAFLDGIDESSKPAPGIKVTWAGNWKSLGHNQIVRAIVGKDENNLIRSGIEIREGNGFPEITWGDTAENDTVAQAQSMKYVEEVQ